MNVKNIIASLAFLALAACGVKDSVSVVDLTVDDMISLCEEGGATEAMTCTIGEGDAATEIEVAAFDPAVDCADVTVATYADDCAATVADIRACSDDLAADMCDVMVNGFPASCDWMTDCAPAAAE